METKLPADELFDLDDELQFDEDNPTVEEEEGSLSDKRRIYTDLSDAQIESLHGRAKAGRLIIQPDFQRGYVWDKIKASRLIESALLEIPLPVVYLAEDKDGRVNVIDGQQRLTSFFSFIDGKFPDNSEFKLTGLQVFDEFNGLTFSQLDDRTQEKIKFYTLRTIKFKNESDPELQFEVFARLNTGSVPLNDQELRNCVYRGRFNKLLKNLSREPDFVYLLGLNARPDKRMKDLELVLRFAAFYFNSYLNYKAPIKSFLNGTMKQYRDISDENAKQLTIAFKNTTYLIRALLDKSAFKRFYKGDGRSHNGRWETKQFNVSLYDILMYSFAREDRNTVMQNLDGIRESLLHLLTEDQDFIDSIELSTSSQRAVTTRFDKWRLTLQQLIGIGTKETRCFSFSLKQKLFEQDPTCAICSNKIQSIDDAAVDHIEQYWTGGKTIPENARLTHRYCNWARARKAKQELV